MTHLRVIIGRHVLILGASMGMINKRHCHTIGIHE